MPWFSKPRGMSHPKKMKLMSDIVHHSMKHGVSIAESTNAHLHRFGKTHSSKTVQGWLSEPGVVKHFQDKHNSLGRSLARGAGWAAKGAAKAGFAGMQHASHAVAVGLQMGIRAGVHGYHAARRNGTTTPKPPVIRHASARPSPAVHSGEKTKAIKPVHTVKPIEPAKTSHISKPHKPFQNLVNKPLATSKPKSPAPPQRRNKR